MLQGTTQQSFAAAALQTQQWHYHAPLKRWFHQSIPADMDPQVPIRLDADLVWSNDSHIFFGTLNVCSKLRAFVLLQGCKPELCAQNAVLILHVYSKCSVAEGLQFPAMNGCLSSESGLK